VRRFYAEQITTEVLRGAAAVTTTTFGRAVAAVFLGLFRPPIPLESVPSVDVGLAWLDTLADPS